LEKHSGESQDMQPLIDKTLNWLETQLSLGIDKVSIEATIYAQQALKLASRNVEAKSKSLIERIKQDLALKINVLVDLPRMDPEAFLDLYLIALDYDPEFAGELRTTVIEDIRKLQLQDGAIIGEHVELSLVLYVLNAKDPAAQSALKYTLKLFDQKVMENLGNHSPTQLYPYIKALIQGGLLDEQASNVVLNSLFIKQNEDGGWGSLIETIYAIRILMMLNTLVAAERIKKGIRFLGAQVKEDGSLIDVKHTALYAITFYEYMAAGSLDQGFEENGILTNSSAYTLRQLLVAAVRRAQSSLVAVNMYSNQLADAILSALETTPTLEVTLIYAGNTENIPESLKQPNQKLRLRLTQTEIEPLMIVDEKLIIFVPLYDEALMARNCFAVKVSDQKLAEKLFEYLDKQTEKI
jgi:hypothetical protein